MTTLTKTAAVAAIAALFASTATAGVINIVLSDMDVSYLGSSNRLNDAQAVAGNNQAAAEADEIQSAVFELDGDTKSVLMSAPTHKLFGDLLIANMPANLPIGAYSVGIGNAGGGFGFDFFSEDGYDLSLGLGTIDLLVTPGVLFFTAPATVLSQNLPAGLKFDADVVISYTATLPAIQMGQTTNSAMASGAMTISGLGVAIPEPGSLALMLLGVTAAATRRRTAC